MSVWNAIKYGFSPVYWVTIGGIPVVFAERSTGLSLPSGYTSEDGSLVIDDSAEVGIEQIDREKGTAVSLSFSFKLLDTDVVRGWLRASSKTMSLTSDLAATATSMAVTDSTGWSDGDAAYLGMERVTIGTVASATSCTGLSRATIGTLAYEHKTSTTGQIITDRPRFWRGRDVVLWASPVDPSGFATGTNIADDAVMAWRGRIAEGPLRETNGFGFEATSIDRIMDRGLLGSVTGSIVDTNNKIAVSGGYTVKVLIDAMDSSHAFVFSYVINLQPFLADGDGALLTLAEIRARIEASWSDAVNDAGGAGDIGGFQWSAANGVYRALVNIPANGLVTRLTTLVYLDGSFLDGGGTEYPAGWGGGLIAIGWEHKGYPLLPNFTGFEAKVAWGLTIKVDEGNVGDIPQIGKLKIKAGGGSRIYSYTEVNTSGDLAYFIGIHAIDGFATPTKGQLEKADVEVLFGDTGTMPGMMLRCLMTSGTGGRSVTYDTLKQGQGYGLDEGIVNVTSFTSATSPVGGMLGALTSAGESFGSLFGGTLGLFRRAVVARPDTTGAIKLTLIETTPYGTAYTATITDIDLLSDDGDPVVSVKKANSGNVHIVIRPHGGVSDEEDRRAFFDAPSIDANGRDEVEYRIPAIDQGALITVADSAVAHLAADETAQAVQLRVPPWVAVYPGDVVFLEGLTHPALWTWSTSPGQPGYDGMARCVGRTINLKSATVTLTFLFDSSLSVNSLSPAALIETAGFDSATNPTYINIPLAYLEHMQKALTEAAGNVWVSHFQPGQIETATQLHEVSAANVSGSTCQLTIASTTGGHTLDVGKQSTLTLPTSSGLKLSAYQALFAHIDDNTIWG